MDGTSSKRTWYIAFSDAEKPRWWMKPFIRKGFGHVTCFCQVGNMVVMLEPQHWGVETSIIHNMQDKNLLMEADLVAMAREEIGATVLKFDVKVDKEKSIRHISMMLPTCVTFVKACIGLKIPHITPYGLYRHLKKVGATEFTSEYIQELCDGWNSI